jgi:hypothetical protein
LACEGGENNQTKAPPAMQNMHDWLGEGGKAFGTHYHYTWFKNGPTDFQNTAVWNPTPTGGAGAGTYTVDTTFPKGKVFYDWLNNVGAITNGGIAMAGVAGSVNTVNAPTQRWIYDSAGGNAVKYMSFLTPIGGIPGTVPADGGEGGPKYCGKAVFTDLHAGGIGIPLAGIPQTCDPTAAMTPQELALEFLFFDLSACVAPENQPPPPPPPPTIQ